MKVKEYFKRSINRPYLLENREEMNLIHQYDQRTMEMELDKMKGKYTMNEIR